MNWVVILGFLLVLVMLLLVLQSIAEVQEGLKSLRNQLTDVQRERSSKVSLRDMAEAKLWAAYIAKGKPPAKPFTGQDLP